MAVDQISLISVSASSILASRNTCVQACLTPLSQALLKSIFARSSSIFPPRFVYPGQFVASAGVTPLAGLRVEDPSALVIFGLKALSASAAAAAPLAAAEVCSALATALVR